MAYSVFVGLVTACGRGQGREGRRARLRLRQIRTWRFAGIPTTRSPLSVNATMEGVVRAPSEFSITLALCGREGVARR